ncbi:DUF805 domain-containing protein [Novosphingobium sp. Chol11]|uniref:DUF805 domain-containing protein n=1 Tax=Novosphingobium sp. Chol11 TaxID=1385763 RepID=UPI00345B546E
MLMPYRRYADFEGRSRRLEYWMFTLFSFLVAMVALAVMVAGGINFGSPEAGMPGPLFYVGLLFLVVWGLGSIIPSIALQVRRFHDQDRSGWLCLFGFIPYVGGLIVLVFMCLPGTSGSNRHGPDPKQPGDASVFS